MRQFCNECAAPIPFDDCDFDHAGSTLGFECRGCGEWCCNAHGDRVSRDCNRCQRFYLTPLGVEFLAKTGSVTHAFAEQVRVARLSA